MLTTRILGGGNTKNKVDGTQNLTYNGKMMSKMLGPTHEKMEKLGAN